MPRFSSGKLGAVLDVRDDVTLFDDNLSTASQYDRWADDLADALRPFVKR